MYLASFLFLIATLALFFNRLVVCAPILLNSNALNGLTPASLKYTHNDGLKVTAEHEGSELYIRSTAVNDTSNSNSTASLTAQDLINSINSNLTSIANATLSNNLSSLGNATADTPLRKLVVAASSLELNISTVTNQTLNLPWKKWPEVSLKAVADNYTILGKAKNVTYALYNVTSTNSTNQTVVIPNSNFTIPFDPNVSGTSESQIRPLPWEPKPLNGSLSTQGVDAGEISDISNLDPEYEWKKVLVDDFSEGLSSKTWKIIENCQPGQVTCFINRTENVKVFNNSLIITPMAELKSKPLQYSSGRVYTEFVWPGNSTLFNLLINAELPNVDSVVPILKLIVNGTIVIDLTSPQVTTNTTIVMGKALSSQNRVWEVTVDRVKGHVQMGKDGFQTNIPVLQGDMSMSIVLSAVIRTSEGLPNGPLLWFGPSEDKDATKLYKRQVTDQGLLDIWALTVYLVKAYFTLS